MATTLEKLNFGAVEELTISSGAITVTQTLHTVDTEADAASDDLATINGGSAGDIVYLYPANTARTVVVKHGTGNILVVGTDSDVTLDDSHDLVCAVYDGTNWMLHPIKESVLAAAPTDAEYLVTASNGTLTAEKVISSLGANLTIAGDDAAGRTITLGQQVTNADTITVDVPVANCTVDGAAVVTTSATQTLTNKTLTSPTITSGSLGADLDGNAFSVQFDDGTGIKDDSGNEVLLVSKAASAVNYLEVGNSATGTGVDLTAAGDDTNVDLLLVAKGSGQVKAGGNRVLTTADEGTGNGLDADTLDGSEGAAFALLAGRSGGQTLTGDTASGGDLTLQSTSHSTKGSIILASGNHLEFPELSSAPSAPASGAGRIYFKTDSLPYCKDAAGNERLLVSSGRYVTVSIPVSGWKAYGTNGAQETHVDLLGSDSNRVFAWKFDDTTSEGIFCHWTVPNDADTSVDIQIKLIWTQDHAGTGTVNWGLLRYAGAADGQTFNQTGLGNTSTTDTSQGEDFVHVTSAITLASDFNPDEVITWKIARQPGVDTLSGDAALIGVQLRYATSDDTSVSW